MLILTLSLAKNTERHVRAMENTLPQNANVIKTITVPGANFGTSVQQIKIAVLKENVWTLEALHCRANNATAIWDGMDQAATRVCST